MTFSGGVHGGHRIFLGCRAILALVFGCSATLFAGFETSMIIYTLPFPPGEHYIVGQADHEFPTHEDKYAVDWIMDEGTPIHAARAGMVADTCDRFTEHGLTPDMLEKGNYVLIRHDDGSFATYIHLAPKGAKVKPGQKVKAGEVIGVSGNTGYSGCPHLHFEVYRLVGNRRETLPTPFRLADGEVAVMVRGAAYTAPGGAAKPDTGPLAGISGTGELSRIPQTIVALVKGERNLPKAAKKLKEHLTRKLPEYQRIYKAVFKRAQTGDKTAMRELQDFMDQTLTQEPDIARLMADPSSEAEAYEAMGLWWKMSPVP